MGMRMIALLCSVFFLLAAAFLASPPKANACLDCISGGGALTCEASITGGCNCKVTYYGRGLWVCHSCGNCFFCCLQPCTGLCDPSDPTCSVCGPNSKLHSRSKIKPVSRPNVPAPAWLMAVADNSSSLADRIALVDDEFAEKMGILADDVQAQLVNKRCPAYLHGKIMRDGGKVPDEWAAVDVAGGGTMILLGNLHWVQNKKNPQGHVEIGDATQVRSLILTDKDWTYKVGSEVKATEKLKLMRYISPEEIPVPLLSM